MQTSSPRTDRTGRGANAASRPARRYQYSAYLYILPALLIYGAFMLFPLGRAVHLSFFEWDGLTLGTFIGFENYLDIVADEQLRAAFVHALVLMFFFAILPVCIGLVLAALLTRAKVRGLPLFRTVVFLPQVIAMVVVAVTWRQIYAPDGLLNSALRAVGLDAVTRSWLGDYDIALPAVGLIGTWVCTGLVTVLLMAGMAKIPVEQYESARLDGAGPIREFFSITVPSVRAETTVALTLTLIASLKTFDLIYMTTRGGPGYSTTVPSYEVYRRAFELGQVGSAAAVGVTITVIIFIISLIVNRLGERSSA
ncbi:carbohydrate ABC transporter permease [Paramicrobacterium agarici]|uniref:Carbohydrate ABC transporter membrane protein 1 (CUT1 family) n=1 Tax=Paramicrobacterium agarici TaxID=630514 RepID=A0A2A9DSH3_9MICO|nr:sugar ABC transporter permease [Microbacterium agarici]PFG29737.1 carbohydrate ABC transporter membrane protein 1 (CUT1 family) [Microbacterium agarici]TQO22759.1 carbohydrate ABC transporter membrane protein 1 (CUT1 family) [Microbacterium agarici]